MSFQRGGDGDWHSPTGAEFGRYGKYSSGSGTTTLTFI